MVIKVPLITSNTKEKYVNDGFHLLIFVVFIKIYAIYKNVKRKNNK